MTNPPRQKILPHLAHRKGRFPNEADDSAGKRWNIRRVLAIAALMLALFMIFPLLERVRTTTRPRTGGTSLVTACDRLAADPSDTQKVAPGVAESEIDLGKAKAACAAALKAQPNDGRLLYEFGRVTLDSGETAAGVDLFRQSAAAGYPQGQFTFGRLLLNGKDTNADACEAGRLWVKAARARHFAAKIYLANAWRAERFKDCGLDITEAEIATMLAAAGDLVEDPQDQEALTQAKTNWAKPAR